MFDYSEPLQPTELWSGDINARVKNLINQDGVYQGYELSVGGIDSSVEYIYNDSGILTKAGDISFEIDDLNKVGVLKTECLPDQNSCTSSEIKTESSLNQFGELKTYKVSRVGLNTQTLFEGDYEDRDNAGRLNGKVEKQLTMAWNDGTQKFEPQLLQSQTTYSYDEYGRIEKVVEDGIQTKYGYDLNGNRTHINDVKVGFFDEKNKLTKFKNNEYLYNSNGSVQTKIVRDSEGNDVVTYSYKYDGTGRMSEILIDETEEDGEYHTKKITFTHDVLGRRIAKQVSIYENNGWEQVYDNRYIYKDGLNPIALVDENNSILEEYIYSEKYTVPSYIIKPDGTKYAVISDHNGSVRSVVNATTGVIVQEIDYNAFGAIVRDTNPGFQPFTFQGGLYDEESNLVHFGANEYDDEVGRWMGKSLNQISIPGTNEYSFVGNDPVNYVNPAGSGHTYYKTAFILQQSRYDLFNYYQAPDTGSTIGNYMLNGLFSTRNLCAYLINSGMHIASLDEILLVDTGFMRRSTYEAMIIEGMRSNDHSFLDNAAATFFWTKNKALSGLRHIDEVFPAIKQTYLSAKQSFTSSNFGTSTATFVGAMTQGAVKYGKVGYEKVSLARDDVLETLFKRWSKGQDIWTEVAPGVTPTWATMKKRYWKNMAHSNPDLFPEEMLEIITKKGNAPQLKTVLNNIEQILPAELHHLFPKGKRPPNAAQRFDFRQYFEDAGINLEKFLLVLDKGNHSKLHSKQVTGQQWLDEWYAWVKDNRNPQTWQLREKMTEMMRKFNLIPEDLPVNSLDDIENYVKQLNSETIESSKNL